MTSRISFINVTLLATIFALGCASKPTSIPAISASANPATELEQTEQMLTDARNRQVDVLSPTNFTEAEEALAKAKKMKEKNKSNEDILKQVSYSRGFLEQANAKAELSQTSMKDITKARADAMAAGAPEQYPKEFAKAGKELEHITKSIEDGDLTPADKRGHDLTSTYRDLEVKSVRKANLSKAEEILNAAKKDKADKKAPKSLALAQMKFDNAAKIISADPKNRDAIRAASADATRESVHLAGVVRKVNAGNTEDLVLTAEKQQSTISNLREEYTSTEDELQASQKQLTDKEKQLDVAAREKLALANREAQLQKSQGVSKTADRIREQFKPTEAEVYTEAGKVMIRLKGLQFAINKATLGPKNQALLKKVGTALEGVETSKITVEGHTDATGNADKNVELSEQRAQAVEKFLVANGMVTDDKVESVGVGPDKPISDNKTQSGRAQNRRIDLVIEMQ